jgi:hypothetical protein
MKALTLIVLNAGLGCAHCSYLPIHLLPIHTNTNFTSLGVTSNFIFNDQITTPFEYIREVSPIASNPDSNIYDPQTYPDTADLICGRNASLGWSHPKVATVKAGDQVGFFVGVGIVTSPPSMYHPGFASAWLSRMKDGREGGLDGYQGEGMSRLSFIETCSQVLQMTGIRSTRLRDAPRKASTLTIRPTSRIMIL